MNDLSREREREEAGERKEVMTSRSPEPSLSLGGNRLRLVALGVILVGTACTASSTPSGQTPTTAPPRPSTAPGSPTRPAVHPTGPITPAKRSTLTGIVAYSTGDGDIWVMHANGTGRRRVTRSGPGFDFDPHLSPNGRSIVFRTSRGRYLRDRRGIGLQGIFVVDVRTRREHPVHPPRGGLFPSWSPDGRAIAFSTLQRDLNGESIHLVTPAGTNLRASPSLRSTPSRRASPGRPTRGESRTAATPATATGRSGR
jgi:hypothetical protein